MAQAINIQVMPSGQIGTYGEGDHLVIFWILS